MPTRWGPLGPADRDLLVMIRQAGLCGGSSGQQAQKQGSNPQVRTVAKRISAEIIPGPCSDPTVSGHATGTRDPEREIRLELIGV